MVPRTSSGRGFKGAAAYYLHDKGASSAERVRFTHTLNLGSDDPERAINEMCWTAIHADEIKAQAGTKNTGRKLEKPVYTFSLSWHPSETPSEEQMRDAGYSALKALKMEHHQVLMVSHNDTAHPHIHLIVNRIDPETGKAHGLNKDQLILSKWAQGYERAHGQTWCMERVKNNAERAQAAFQKAKGERDSAFVKDTKSQQRDRPGEAARRKAQQKARATEQGTRAHQAARAAQRSAAEAARVAERARDQAARKAALEAALERAAAVDAREKREELYRAKEIEPPDDPRAARAAFAAQKRGDAKRALFEAWKTAQLNTLQDQQNAARGALGQQQQKRRMEVDRRIEKHYGKSQRAGLERLAWLTEREQRGSGFSRWLDRVRGLGSERKALEKTLANIAMRSHEMRAPLERQETTERALLEDQHRLQKQHQAAEFERGEQAGYEISAPPAAARAGGDEKGRGVEGDGRERGRGFSRGR